VSAGRLIVLEGPEGAGKTTQLRLLARLLEREGHSVLTLREPGGTPLGDSIRTILLDSPGDISPEAEALLFMASRAEIMSRHVDPALDDGVIVLMDRFFLSTYAYQIAGRGLDEAHVRAANELATGGRRPDLNLVIEIPPADGLARAAMRGSHDRMERSGADFHVRVSDAFAKFSSDAWQKTHAECGKIVQVDGRGSPDEVHRRILKTLAQNLPQEFGMLDDVTTV
jgi:thymidylate kinase